MAESPDTSATPASPRLPAWLRSRFDGGRARHEVRGLLRELHLHTVCESARCPNLCECWGRQAATLLLLGDRCTRHCRFCAVDHGTPLPPDPAEPSRVVEAVRRLGLRFVVLTCVTRDDLADGGAAHLAAVVRSLREALPAVGVELLASDFGGLLSSVDTVLEAGLDVFNHNLETTERLTPLLRNRADYRRSLRVLAYAASQSAAAGRPTRVKSGLMLGLGEGPEEIRSALQDLRQSGVSVLTLGQYLPPTPAHWPLQRYVTPEEFREWEAVARRDYGFAAVVSGPLVRSSYGAETAALAAGADAAGVV
ncbi:MAG: lipoyl synthase [Lentisphaerae bacterium]|nr:lipoyl synthase [Lentisphaerota bacterium]